MLLCIASYYTIDLLYSAPQALSSWGYSPADLRALCRAAWCNYTISNRFHQGSTNCLRSTISQNDHYGLTKNDDDNTGFVPAWEIDQLDSRHDTSGGDTTDSSQPHPPKSLSSIWFNAKSRVRPSAMGYFEPNIPATSWARFVQSLNVVVCFYLDFSSFL